MFQHERLASDRSIRLLQLHASASSSSRIVVSLSIGHLDEVDPRHLQYEALSYVWGSSVGTVPIVCNKKALLVTPSCESALRHLRLKDRTRVLWVDSICIDQDNTAESIRERNILVASMGEIYAKASSTLCWLGEGTPYSQEVMRRLYLIGSCPSLRGLGKLLNFEKQLHLKGMLDADISCLDHVFCHPWHSRIWTVQEVAFSRDCQVVCGSSSIPWDKYFRAAKFLIFENYIDTLNLQASRNMVGIDMRNVLQEYITGHRSDDHYDPKDTTEDDILNDRDRRVVFLSSCLTDANQLQATNPKDKIYGLQALYTALGIQLPPVDYSQSIASVYTRATIAMILWSDSLKILRDACTINRQPNLPSWVPDWNDATARMYMPDTDATNESKLGVSAAATLSKIPGRLQVRGIVVGSVVAERDGGVILPYPTKLRSGMPPILSDHKRKVVEDIDFLRLLIDKIGFLRELVRIIETNSDLFPEENGADVFHDMVTFGQRSFRDDLFAIWLDILAYPTGQFEQAIGKDLATRWMAADTTNSAHWTSELLNCATIVASLVCGNSITNAGEPLSTQAEISDLVKELSENLADQAVITVQPHQLDATRTLGMTFHRVLSDDLVVLLQGADWPVVLRPIGSGSEYLHVFVGPAYVIGLMDGQAWPEQEGAQMREFVLV